MENYACAYCPPTHSYHGGKRACITMAAMFFQHHSTMSLHGLQDMEPHRHRLAHLKRTGEPNSAKRLSAGGYALSGTDCTASRTRASGNGWYGCTARW